VHLLVDKPVPSCTMIVRCRTAVAQTVCYGARNSAKFRKVKVLPRAWVDVDEKGSARPRVEIYDFLSLGFKNGTNFALS